VRGLAGVYRLRDGLIASERVYLDREEASKPLGCGSSPLTTTPKNFSVAGSIRGCSGSGLPLCMERRSLARDYGFSRKAGVTRSTRAGLSSSSTASVCGVTTKTLGAMHARYQRLVDAELV
jgi:hypothetical protein